MAARVPQKTPVAEQEQTREMRRPAGPGRGTRWARVSGIALGTALLVVAWRHGIRLRLPLHPALLAGFGGFLVEAGALMGLSVWAAHLVRRHHRTVIRYAVRQGRQHAATAAGGAVAGAGRVHQWAASRWAGRGDSWGAPLMVKRRQRDSGEPGAEPGAGPEPLPPLVMPIGEFATGPRNLAIARVGTMTLIDGGGEGLCVQLRDWAFGDPSQPPDAVAHLDNEGMRRALRGWSLAELHELAHARDCRCPIWRLLYLRAPRKPADAPAPAPTTDGGNMTPHDAPATGAPAARHAGTLQAPGAWGALVTETAEFEAGDETELLEWMAAQVEGMLRYGEAIAEMHEHHVSAAVRLDLAAMAMMRDVAEAAAEAASVMAQAREKFKEVYEAPREFVADGGVLPKDGDFMTGEDEA